MSDISTYPTAADVLAARQSRSQADREDRERLELAARYLLENVEPLTDHQDAAFARLRDALGEMVQVWRMEKARQEPGPDHPAQP